MTADYAQSAGIARRLGTNFCQALGSPPGFNGLEFLPAGDDDFAEAPPEVLEGLCLLAPDMPCILK